MINEKQINQTEKAAGCVLFSFLIIILLHSVYSSAKGYHYYEMSQSQEKLSSDAETEYYKQVNFLLSKAISFDPGESLYYTKKGDNYFDALVEGFGSELNISDGKIVELYEKAIRLDSANFINYLKLGWFYSSRDKEKAQKFLNIAVKLNSSKEKNYYYLAKHYLKTGNEKEAFNAILKGVNSIKEKYSSMRFVRELKIDEHTLPNIEYRVNKYLQFNLKPSLNEFDFKKEDFPHIQVPLTLCVYIKDDLAKVELLRRDIFFKDFLFSDTKEGLSLFEFDLDLGSSEFYLNDFSIKARSFVPIEKIELVFRFFS